MAVSGNGWPVSPSAAELGVETMTIGGASFQVRGGKPRQALEYVITQVHNRVEKANAAYGCYGYSYRMNVNNPGVWSNHASATAVDFNATRHPNGVPAAATFTAAQIAEIHQILAEVGGVVRWGGDYNGTPDAMHFEIDATPEGLDVAVDTNAIPENGQIKAIGAPTLEFPSKIPYLTENSVSYPTMMNYGHGYAQWRYNPTQTGKISIDAILSHYADPAVEADNPQGPLLNLYIFEVAVGSDGAIYPKYGTEIKAPSYQGPPFRLAGQMNVDVVAGKKYIIRTTCTPSYPWIRAVVRIGDFAKISDWITPPPVEGIVTLGGTIFHPENYPFPQPKSLYYASYLDSSGYPSGDQSYIYESGHAGWLWRSGISTGARLNTSYAIRNTIFGQAPWARGAGTAGIECAWRWGRRYRGEQQWSTGPGISWYGPRENEIDFNFIYNANGAGSAACWLQSEMNQKMTDRYDYALPVGVRYHAPSPFFDYWDGEAHRAALFGSGTNSEVRWDVYGGSIIVDFDAIRFSAGASGWGGAWPGPGWYHYQEGYRPMYMPDVFDPSSLTSPTAEWENPTEAAKILSVEWALDEYSFPTNTWNGSGYTAGTAMPRDNAVGAGAVAEWYVKKIGREENIEGYYSSSDYVLPDPPPYGHWGPWGNADWWTRAPGDGPNSWVATAEHLMTTAGGSTSAWAPLDSSYWSSANDQTVDFGDIDFTYDGDSDFQKKRAPVPAQVRFVILPRASLSDAMPFTPPLGSQYANPDFPIEDWLQGQSIALRVKVQPNRYRIIYQPVMPDITYAGGPNIDMNPEASGQVLY